MLDKLIIFDSAPNVFCFLFLYKRDYKNNNLKDNIWLRVADQLGQLGIWLSMADQLIYVAAALSSQTGH